MKTDEAIKILEKHNKWRRCEPPYDGDILLSTLVCPKQLGKAIDCAIEHMKRFRWRPIEEAPRDGTLIIISGGLAYWREDAAGGAWYSITGIDYPGRCIKWEPTHFMPLPEFDGEENDHGK